MGWVLMCGGFTVRVSRVVRVCKTDDRIDHDAAFHGTAQQ